MMDMDMDIWMGAVCFSKTARAVDEAVIHNAIGRIVVGLGPGVRSIFPKG